jgi:hypothetical protein
MYFNDLIYDYFHSRISNLLGNSHPIGFTSMSVLIYCDNFVLMTGYLIFQSYFYFIKSFAHFFELANHSILMDFQEVQIEETVNLNEKKVFSATSLSEEIHS